MTWKNLLTGHLGATSMSRPWTMVQCQARDWGSWRSMPTLHSTSTEKCILREAFRPSTSGTLTTVLQVHRVRGSLISHLCYWESLYTWFLGVILIKKAGDGDSKKIKGCWDSIHVVEVQEKSSGRSAHYKLTSTSMLWLQTNKARSGTMNLGGSLTRQVWVLASCKYIPYGMWLLFQSPIVWRSSRTPLSVSQALTSPT